MIIITYRQKVMLDKEVPSLYDPLTKDNGVAFVISQKYSEIFLLAFFPASKKTVTAYSMTTNDPIPLAVWTPEMQKEADLAKSEAKGTWKLFMFWYVFFIIIGGAFIYTRTQMHSKGKNEKQQAEYFENPQVGDIVYSDSGIDDNMYDSSDDFVSPFKIVGFKNDTIILLASSEKQKKTDFILEPSKLTGAFNLADNQFKGDTLKFKKEYYANRSLISYVDTGKGAFYSKRIMYIDRK